MTEGISELQRTANQAFEKALEAHMAATDLQREMKRVGEELGYLKVFSRRLLGVLKLQFQLKDSELDGMMLKAEEAYERLEEKPGFHVAPLCTFCERPLQEDSKACIYCSREAVRA